MKVLGGKVVWFVIEHAWGKSASDTNVAQDQSPRAGFLLTVDILHDPTIVIRRLALINPSTLAQIIPATRQKQNAWLQALQNWCERMASRSEASNNRCLFFEWAATNYPGVTYTEANGAYHMVGRRRRCER